MPEPERPELISLPLARAGPAGISREKGLQDAPGSIAGDRDVITSAPSLGNGSYKP
jgi:hypothetical protein